MNVIRVFPTSLALLFAATVIALSLTLFFVFATSHRVEAYRDDLWGPILTKEGLNPREFSHDADSWYWKGKFTCVGYGDWEDSCDKSKFFCADRRTVIDTRNGSPQQQVEALKEAMKSGAHPACPLL